MKSISKILSLVIVVALGSPFLAYAQTSPIDATTQTETAKDATPQDVVEEVEEPVVIAEIADGVELTPEEKRVRAKEGLGKALVLALEKVQKLTIDLEDKEFSEDSIEYSLQQQFLGQLDSYMVFYTEKSDALGTLEALEDIQALAKEIKSYRDDTYTPGVEDIVEFILVFYSENVINIANERLVKISADLDKLAELGLLEEDPFKEKITEIEALLAEATLLQNKAWSIVVVSPIENVDLNPEEAAITPDTQVDATSTVNNENGVSEDTLPTAKELLETSLGNVKTVYTDFLEISASVKETLGI